MNDTDARQLLQNILDEVAPGADLSEVASDSDLRVALDLDSLDFLNLVAAVDEQTGGQTSEQDYPQLTTVAGCAAFLSEREQRTRS